MWDKQRCFYSDVFVAISAIGILPRNTPLEVILLKNHLAVVVPSRTALPGIGICSAPLDRENSSSKKPNSNASFLALHGAASCSTRSLFLFQTEPLLAPKLNPKVDIGRGLHSGTDATEFWINMILPGATGYVAEVLVADVLCTVTGSAKPTGS